MKVGLQDNIDFDEIDLNLDVILDHALGDCITCGSY